MDSIGYSFQSRRGFFINGTEESANRVCNGGEIEKSFFFFT